MRVRVVVGVIGAALLVAGCGSGTVSGKADAQGVGPGEPVFSPCDDIPADALRAVGVDPATEERDILGLKQPKWNLCGWRGADHHLSVFATTYSLEDIRINKKNEEFAGIDLRGRTGFSYREASDRRRESCDVAIESGSGAVLVSSGYFGATRPPNAYAACDLAIQAARVLLPHIPE